MTATATELRERVTRTGPRRRDRWTWISDRYDGPRWRLDGTHFDLESDPAHTGGTLRGQWVLWIDGRETGEPVDHFLDAAMEWAEDAHDSGELRCAHKRVPALPGSKEN